MDALAAGLAGVIVGAIISEALRVWHDYWQRRRRVRGVLRLLRAELAITSVILEDEDLTASDLRRRVRTGAISVDRWNESQALLSETLNHQEWVTLAAPYMGIALMIAEPDEPDDVYVTLALRIRDDIREANEVIWSKDRQQGFLTRNR